MKNDARAERPTIPAALVRYAETTLPTRFGDLRCLVYRRPDGLEQVAMVKGNVDGQSDVLCRVHSECMTSEVFGSLKCDCREQLDQALERISEASHGVVIYLRQEGRGIGLGNKIRAYAMQEEGFDTVDANRVLGLPDDARDYRDAAVILNDLGVRSVSLMTNNPLKVDGLRALGIDVTKREAHIVDVKGAALDYVKTKRTRMGHHGPMRALRHPDA